MDSKKSFFIPIVSLVIFSIAFISITNAYLNIATFKSHIQKDIQTLKQTYLTEHKRIIKSQVKEVLKNIDFQITKVEQFAKEKLKERILTAIQLVNFIYSKRKDQLSSKQIQKLVAKHLSALTYGKNGYFFIYDFDTNIILWHIKKELIGKDMTNFKDKQGQNLVQLYKKVLAKDNIAYAKIYFPKPNDKINQQTPKLVALTKIKPLNIVIGTGIYLDEVTKNRIKEIA
jgi:signal transduction histidine kinase